MGLCCSHGAFDGGYFTFMRLRIFTLYAAGGKILELNYASGGMNITWAVKDEMEFDEGFDIFFTHCDCDGKIKYKDCDLVSKSLAKILQNMKNVNIEDVKKYIGDHILTSKYTEMLATFIAGCDLCVELKEDMGFF